MRLKHLILALFAVLAFGALTAVSVMATEGSWEKFTGTLKYTGSSTFHSISLTTKLLDEKNGSEFNCKESAVGGHAEPSGTSNANDGPLFHITLASWNKGAENCEASFGIKFAVVEAATSAKPWLFHALWRLVADPHHHFLGLLLGIHALLKGTECELEVNGKVPALLQLFLKGAQPEALFRFNKLVNANTAGEANTLTITILKESGLLKCGGAATGDKAAFDGEYEETEGPTNITFE